MELVQAADQLAATSEVLRAISNSRSDPAPVLKVVAEHAARLCDADISQIFQIDGDFLRVVAAYGPIPSRLRGEALRISRGSVTGRAVIDRRTIHVDDLSAQLDKEFPDAKPHAGLWGHRTTAATPLLREQTPIGAIFIRRTEVRPFSEQQIAVLETFAAQASIAIEQVRLVRSLEARNAQLSQALDREAATGEILQVINRSPTVAEPVFEAILGNALRLCGAHLGTLFLFDAETFRLVAHRGAPAEWVERRRTPLRPGPHTGLARAVTERRPVHIIDVTADRAHAEHDQTRLETIELLGARSGIWVPMLKEERAVGVITMWRREVQAFTDSQIDLLVTFAAQAVIAMENVRLFSETKEALEQQTATSEILRVISSSPSDLQPVFDTIVRNFTSLCGAVFGSVFTFDGDLVHYAGGLGFSPERERAHRAKYPVRVDDPSVVSARTILAKAPVHIDDTLADAQYDPERAATLGVRRILGVPMLREGVPVGAIVGSWAEPGVTPKHQEQLLKTFADQAVIAIENVRLFNETKEALEQQRATGEILASMSESIIDAKPVFDAIVRNLLRLFGTRYASVALVRDGKLEIAGIKGDRGYESLVQRFPVPINDQTLVGKVALSGKVMQFAPMVGNPAVPPGSERFAREFGFNSQIMAPMIRDGEVIGVISTAHRDAVLFNEQQVALLKSFAAQAVIAIENVRLFNETKEALDQQKASADVLGVISSSIADTKPVFDKILESCVRLFEGYEVGIIVVREDGLGHLAAYNGPDKLHKGFPIPVDRRSATGLAIVEQRVLHFPDVSGAADAPEVLRRNCQLTGTRSIMLAPMLREGQGVGAIFVGRSFVGPFSEKAIRLLGTFADQAVIAIENVRLFTELQTSNRDLTTALDTQTATSDILRVISRSQTDVQPVFDAIVHSAVRLLRGYSGALSRVSGHEIVLMANTSTDETGDAATKTLFPLPLRSEFPHAQAIRAGTPFNVADAETDDRLPEDARTYAHVRGYRSWIVVPMLRQNEAIGAIGVTRREAGGFTDDEIALLKTFADQAVIAIQNARLFNETKEALERQTATAEILKVISSSPTETQPVFDAIVESGARLFAPSSATIVMRQADELVRKARAGPRSSEVDQAKIAAIYPLPFDPERSMVARCIIARRIIEIPDTEAEGLPPVMRALGKAAGYRAITLVPLIREGEGVGVIGLSHPQPGFKLSEKQLALVRTFADQAVIAIENVRLFNELQSRTQALTKSVGQLTALGAVGRAISSTLDLETVLKTIVSHAVKLTGLDSGAVYEYDEAAEAFHLRAGENLGEEIIEVLHTRPIKKGDGVVGRTAVTREPMQIHDTQDESYQSNLRDLVIRTGRRALLAVPLMRESHIIGALTVQRNTPGPFAPEVVELLKTFATQSAMAIQNARLYREIEQKSRELETASKHKSQFLASMSHELRTPLNAILGFNEMVIDEIYGPVPEGMKSPLENIQSSGKHLLRLINNVLDLAKIEAGRMELALSDYSVQDTVSSVHSTLRPLAAEKGLEFVAEVSPDIPPAHGDAGRLAQCLMNLAGNSLKFTRQGRVEIAVAQRDGLLRFSVADTGIGIAPEKIASLFTEFKQTDATIASEYGGTGLGLSITKKFIEMHGGRIWVDSEPGKGSNFLFEIPLKVGR